MPIVQITLIEGRSDEQKEAMYHEVTEAIVNSLGAPRESVRIMVYEVPPKHFATAGVRKAGASGTAPKSGTVGGPTSTR